MKYISILAFIFLSTIVFFSWGLFAGIYKTFPFPILKATVDEIQRFAKGDELEKETTIIEKLQNDFGSVPKRELTKANFPGNITLKQINDRTGKIDESYSKQFIFMDREKLKASNIEGFFVTAKVRLKNLAEERSCYLIVDIEGNLLKVIDSFGQKETDGECDDKSGYKFYSRINNSTELIQLNSCGVRDWAVKSKFLYHHFRQDNQTKKSVWIFDGVDLVEHSKKDGTELQRITMSSVINSNPLIHIFESRLKTPVRDKWIYGEASFDIRKDGEKKYTRINNADFDPFHPNGIDPLSEEFAEKYEMFEQGDLLVSFRSINLLFVVRPSNKKIIWYSYGLTSRQHDPDWNERGTITVFDNKFHNSFSVISEISPKTNTLDYLVGVDDSFSFYKATGGAHELSRDGKLIFFGSDAFIYGKSRNETGLCFFFANQFNNGNFHESVIEAVLDKQTMIDICKTGCE